MALVLIGRLGKVHGLSGELSLERCSLTAEELTAVREFTWRGRVGEDQPLVLGGVRPVHGRMLVWFAGHDDRDRAAALARGELMADAARLPDPGPGLAYAFQIVGLRVETADGRSLGTVADIISTAANPVYVVRGDRELLIPVVAHVVRSVDLARGVITVVLPPGLEEL